MLNETLKISRLACLEPSLSLAKGVSEKGAKTKERCLEAQRTLTSTLFAEPDSLVWTVELWR